MITTKKLLTTVEFAKTKENGVIAVGADRNSLILQQLISPATVGGLSQKENIKDMPVVEMNFYTKESVDVVIQALKNIRENIEFHLPLAC